MWPNARISVMGGEQAAAVMSEVGQPELGAELREQYERQGRAIYSTARIWDDGVIDPRDTRAVLAAGARRVHAGPAPGRRLRRLPDVIEHPETPRASWRAGLRAGVPYAGAGFLLSLSFGVLSKGVGFTPLEAILTSAIVFAGSAQFAAVSILAAGGGVGAVVAAVALVNARFLAMGIALAPSLPGGPLKRAAPGPADRRRVVGDGLARRRELRPLVHVRLDRRAVRHLAGRDARRRLRRRRARRPGQVRARRDLPDVLPRAALRRAPDPAASSAVAAGGALIALVLIPFTPAGVPVLAASLAAFAGAFARERRPKEPAQ